MNVRTRAWNAVNTLNFQAIQIDGLDALVDNQGHRRAVSSKQLVEIDAEHGIDRGRGIIVEHTTRLLCCDLPGRTSRIVWLRVGILGDWRIG